MRLIFVGLAFIVFISGCSMGKIYYGYIVDVKNDGMSKLHDVEIESRKGFLFRTGYLIPGAVKGIGRPQPGPPNDVYTIILKREGEAEVKQFLDLRDQVEKDFRGRILIIINDSNELKYELQNN